MAKARLLVVDDSPDDRDLMQRRLGKLGYEVTLAADGAAGLALIADETFDLVILDLMMPGIDGMEALRRLRAIHSAEQLPVIMVTGVFDMATQEMAGELGANHFILKPVVIEVVEKWIEKLLHGAEAHAWLQDASAS